MSPIKARIGVTLSIVILLLAAACSDARKSSVPFNPETGKHPANWIVDHRAAFLADTGQCAPCHGSDLKGGTSGVSCFSASFNGFSCHANGPSGHPAAWDLPVSHGAAAKASSGFSSCQNCHGGNYAGGAIGPTCLNTAACHGAGVNSPHAAAPWVASVTSTMTHTTTMSDNAAVCGLCHLGNRQPPVYAALAQTVGCFDNTLCHGQVGHAAGWANPDTHGAAAKSAPSATAMQGFSTCQACHGANFGGGTATTCFTCHGVSAPHAFPWQSTSTRKHSTTDAANASSCGLCHLANRQPPTYAALTVTVGCFDNTLCHGQVGHAAGWANPDTHGVAAKSAPSATAMQGFSTCQACHGANFAGGTATTCLNTAGCHGAAVNSPHSFPWQSTSARKHSTADTANATSCGLCHLANRQPPAYATLTVTVGCFDNTLCHGQAGHAAGWNVPAAHGAAAKASSGFSSCQACHGANFAGGSATTCLNTAGCHGAGVNSPHAAAPWFASVTSTMTHTTTNENNAAVCGLCHLANRQPPSYVALTQAVGCFDNTLCHSVAGDCVTCHSLTQNITTGPLAGGTRRAVALEFNNTWSHKRSAGGTVTKYDCIVCHMEGDMTTGSTSAVHRNGLIELRDPDTGATIKGVTFGGADPGSYTSTGTDMTFARFSRDLSSNVLESEVQAIMINQCLKCHDADGATSISAQVPTTGTSLKPFGTTITGHAAPFNSNGNGNVVDAAGSFNPANATYHPVMGKQNNSYTQGTRMVAPWNLAKTNGNNTQYGNLISCWDCHAPAGAAGIQTSTVTAHGAPATLRAPVRNSTTANTAATNLCLNCHATVYATTAGNHGTGSAYATGGSAGNMTTTIFSRCYNCHSYNGAVGATVSAAGTRPNRAEDVHGFNDRTPGAAGSTWTSGSRPYAFMRNTLSNWAPTSATGDTITGAHTCTGTGGTCNNNMNNDSYTPGGVY